MPYPSSKHDPRELTDRHAIPIRPATRDDVAAIDALIAESARALSGGYYSAAQIESLLRFVFGPDTQLIEDGTYFVIERDARLVGAGGWSRRRTLFGGDQLKDGKDPLLDPRSEAARIRAFFVHPAAARNSGPRPEEFWAMPGTAQKLASTTVVNTARAWRRNISGMKPPRVQIH
jgi:hypothetical protein